MKTPVESPSSPQRPDVSQTSPPINGPKDGIGPETSFNPTIDENRASSMEEVIRSRNSSIVEENSKIPSPLPQAETKLAFSALSEERDALRDEVAQIRKTLEVTREEHEEELDSIRGQLVTVQSEKEQAEAQYRGLLGKVSAIRSQLGERLKADAVNIMRRMFGLLLTLVRKIFPKLDAA